MATDMEKYVRIGDVIEVAIDTVAFGGNGVGRIHDLVVFVPFTVEGDRVEVEITAVRKRYLEGKIRGLSILSPHREQPLCRYFTHCGGCQYQHIRYDHQLQIKQHQVMDTFKRIGKFLTPPVREVIPSPRLFHYRGKADYHIYLEKDGWPVLGFMDTSGRQVIEIEHCVIVEETINQACLAYRKDLIAGRTKAIHERQTIWSDPAGEKPAEIVTDFRIPQHVTRMVKGKPFTVPYLGFFQANTFFTDRLVDYILELSHLTGKETVVDVYCGSGLFSLFLAPHARQVFGIEIDREAVKCARKNLADHGLGNAIFIEGNASRMIKQNFIGPKARVDVIILDPPRTGCDLVLLSTVIQLNPTKVIYISCNPATQARDIRYLADRGFNLKILQPLDMFPQTAHIEVAGLLET